MLALACASATATFDRKGFRPQTQRALRAIARLAFTDSLLQWLNANPASPPPTPASIEWIDALADLITLEWRIAGKVDATEKLVLVRY